MTGRFVSVQNDRNDSCAVLINELPQETTIHFDLRRRSPPNVLRCFAVLSEVLRGAHYYNVLTPFNARLFPGCRASIVTDLCLAVGFKVQSEALVLDELCESSELVVEFPVSDATFRAVADEDAV